MSNNWRKYATNDDHADAREEQDPRKVLDEEWEFNRKHWHLYLVAAFLGFSASALVIWVFLSIMGAIYN